MQKLFITLFTLALTSACGFSPLYQQHHLANQGIVNRLAQVKVLPIAVSSESKQSRHLANNLSQILNNNFNPSEQQVTPSYILTIKVTHSTDNVAIRKQGEPTRYRVDLSASYQLQDLHNSDIADTGTVRVSSSYDTSSSEFANFSATATMIDTNTQQLAYELKLRVVNFLIDQAL